MLIKSKGFPDIVLGARKFNKPDAVIAAILMARKEEHPANFISVLKESLNAGLYLVESDSLSNRVTIKSLDTSMKVGNEDEHLYKEALK